MVKEIWDIKRSIAQALKPSLRVDRGEGCPERKGTALGLTYTQGLPAVPDKINRSSGLIFSLLKERNTLVDLGCDSFPPHQASAGSECPPCVPFQLPVPQLTQELNGQEGSGRDEQRDEGLAKC